MQEQKRTFRIRLKQEWRTLVLYLIKRKLFELKIKNAIRKANAPVEFYGSLNGMRKSDVIKLAIKEHLKIEKSLTTLLPIWSCNFSDC